MLNCDTSDMINHAEWEVSIPAVQMVFGSVFTTVALVLLRVERTL